jgi:hypothetical protein
VVEAWQLLPPQDDGPGQGVNNRAGKLQGVVMYSSPLMPVSISVPLLWTLLTRRHKYCQMHNRACKAGGVKAQTGTGDVLVADCTH